MNVTITPGLLEGTVTPPPSKSMAHRLLLCAALAPGESTLSHIAFSEDIKATLRCVEALGASWEQKEPETIRLRGAVGGHTAPDGALPHFDCGESGSTLRFLIPIALALRGGGVFTGRGRLMERPLGPYFDLFREKNIFYEQKDGVLTVRGALRPGKYALPGNVSSQFFTGLLYALPLLGGDSELLSTTPIESAGYLHMTRQAMGRFGVDTGWSRQTFRIPGNQTYRPADCAVEADWSQAAFWYAAQGIGNQVEVVGMDENSLQGDKVILDWGGMLRNEPLSGGVSVPVLGQDRADAEKLLSPVSGRSGRYAVGIDVSHSPDLVPPAAVWGALTPGCDLYLKNAGRLRIKESDRLDSVTKVLNAMGAEVREEADSLFIRGRAALRGGVTVDSCNDHRIAMMAAVAATKCERPVTVAGAECVAKSYPNFWEEFQRLGGKLT